MAEVEVRGEVSRLNNSGNGFGLRETWQVRGESKQRYWSVFPPGDDPRTVNVGDVVTVAGRLGTKVSDRDNRYVDHTVNAHTVTVVTESGQGASDSSGSVPGDTYANSGPQTGAQTNTDSGDWETRQPPVDPWAPSTYTDSTVPF